MISEAQVPYKLLKTSYFHRQWGDEMIGSWDFGFVGTRQSRRFSWSFHRDSTELLPRGYTASLQQRFDLGTSLPVSGSLLTSLRFEESGTCQLLVEPIEGEPLPLYLSRVQPSLRTTLGLMRDMVSSLGEFSKALRLLSNLSPNDFLVKVRNGASLEAEAHPAFAILRDEVSKMDFEIACYWVDYVARVHAAAKDKWSKPVADYDPAGQRTFRKLIKALHHGKEMSMVEALEELERCIRRELDSLRPGSNPVREDIVFPLGPLRQVLVEELRLEHPEKVDHVLDDGRIQGMSPFVLPLNPDSSPGEKRCGIILPPEGWFEDSLVSSVNRKMATPFLSSHPNTMRIRSLFCEENFSLLIADPVSTIPLPTLFEMRGGFETADVLRIADKVRRALDQFDSADFEFEIETPWQIEIYFIREKEVADWKELVSKSCQDWPVWDVRIRVEIPTESLLDSPERSSWHFVLKRLEGKAFPSLVAWMLEWRRLEWASRQGALEREPISWDRRFDSLFVAAGDYFKPCNPIHRERLVSLLKEGYALNEKSI